MSSESEEFKRFLEEAKEYLLEENINIGKESVDNATEESYGKDVLKEKLEPKKIKPIIIETKKPEVSKSVDYSNLNIKNEV